MRQQQEISIDDIHGKKAVGNFEPPSKIHILKIVIKLLPLIINFRKDRREWVKQEGKNVDTKKYRKNFYTGRYFADAIFGSAC